MNTEQKKAAPAGQAAKVLDPKPSGIYVTIPIKAVTASYVQPDKSRRFLVMSGRGVTGDDMTLVFSFSGKPGCWIQVSELKGAVQPQNAVTSFLLSSRTWTALDQLQRDLELSRKAYWKLFNEKRRLTPDKRKKKSRR